MKILNGEKHLFSAAGGHLREPCHLWWYQSTNLHGSVKDVSFVSAKIHFLNENSSQMKMFESDTQKFMKTDLFIVSYKPRSNGFPHPSVQLNWVYSAFANSWELSGYDEQKDRARKVVFQKKIGINFLLKMKALEKRNICRPDAKCGYVQKFSQHIHLNIFTPTLIAKFEVASWRVQKVSDVFVIDLEVGHRHLRIVSKFSHLLFVAYLFCFTPKSFKFSPPKKWKTRFLGSQIILNYDHFVFKISFELSLASLIAPQYQIEVENVKCQQIFQKYLFDGWRRVFMLKVNCKPLKYFEDFSQLIIIRSLWFKHTVLYNKNKLWASFPK